jgi:hypothetical protein
MTQLSFLTLGESSRRRFTAGALAASLIVPTPASAFFQQTSLEGTLGTDLGGVWLSVHNLTPEFRISYPKPKTGPAVPVEVGPSPPEYSSILGNKPLGVVITKCLDATFCADNGVLVGDVILDVNTRLTTDAASFQQAAENAPQQVMLSIRRPALKMTTLRLIKIKYGPSAQKAGADGSSPAEESMDLRVLDVALPLDEKVEASRVGHDLIVPTAAELESLGKGWAELKPASPARYATGKHRFVAREAFDESLLNDKNLSDSKFAIVMDMKSNPMKGGGGQVIDVYGIETIDSKKMTGNYVSVTLANAPFPINIEFKGRFEMTRIADWSEQDEKIRAAEEAKKPKEELDKFKTLPDVPAPAAPAP